MKNATNKVVFVVFVVWISVSLMGILYLSSEGKAEFDPKQRLLNAALSPTFDDELVRLISSTNQLDGATVVHFQASACGCNLISQSHRQSVAALAAKNQYKNVELEPSDELQAFVPSTPAVAVIDNKGKLTYFGPYSSGLFCSENEGLVEPFISEVNTKMPNAVVISDANGCYCEV